jgi:flagellar hook assembly protein FlgD
LTVSEIKCYPNPLNNEITIEINISEDMHIQVELLNQLGQRVRFVTNKHLFNAGLHKFTWNGTSASNQNVSPGIYHLKVIAGEKEYRKKLFIRINGKRQAITT